MANQKVKEMEPVETQIVEIMPPDVENLIYVVRNKQVMVDSDLAMLYQVETKALNRAVKRNIKRFPEDFCFQLTTEETESLRCQSGTSKVQEPEKRDGRGGRRTLPYVFTEQGISMLASVLHSEVAINVSIGIMRAFVEMRRFIANNALLFERISNVELKQHPKLDAKYTRAFHDRFLILDKTKAYHVGASLKDAGKKCFGINLIEDAGIVRDILQRLELETEE